MGFDGHLKILLFLAGLISWIHAQDQVLSGTVLLSSGKTIKGEIEMDHPGVFSIYSPEMKRRMRISPSKVARVTFTVEKEELLQGWMFQEESRNTKIRLPFFRPIRELRVTVTLKTGQRIKGHMDPAVLHVFEEKGDEEEEHKIVLTSHQRGKKGQKLEDLVWVREIVLGKAGPGTKLSSISIRVSPDILVRAISLEHRVSYGGKPAKGDIIHFSGILPGKVFVFAKKDGEIFAGWPEGSKPLSEPDLEAIRNKVADVEEYFDEKRILASGTWKKGMALAVVQGRRIGKTTFKNRKQARWDVYVFEKIEKGVWEIKQRIFLFRISGKVPGKTPQGVSRVTIRKDFVVSIPDEGKDIDLGEVKL